MKMTTDPRPGPANGSAAHGGRADSRPAGLSLAGAHLAGGRRAARRTARRHAARFVGFAPAVSLASTPVLWVLGAGPDVIAPIGLAAAVSTMVASFAHALWCGVRRGDWSAFDPGEVPRNDDDFDFFTRSGAYLDLRIQADHEALMRDGDRFLEDRDRVNFLA